MNDMPTTPAQMFDLLHHWFGIGNHDEIASSQPWHRERMIEIGKLKRMLKSRRASLTEVFIAAEYARRNNKPVHATWEVFALIPEAMREHFRIAKQERREEAGRDLQAAIDEAIEAGEHEWADRLMRAQDHAQAVAEWRARS